MDRVVQFKPHLRAELAENDVVFLIGEHTRFILRGHLQAQVIALIDGKRTIEDIIEALTTHGSPQEIFQVLFALQQNGYLVEAGAALSSEAAAFWHALGFEASVVAERLAATPVGIIALGHATPEALATALSGVGITVRSQAKVYIALTDDYLAPELEALDRRARTEGFAWLPLQCIGTRLWVGSVFHPDNGPCWQCLTHRLRGNRPIEAFIARQRDGDNKPLSPPRAQLPTSTRAGLDIAALALARWIVAGAGKSPLNDHILTLDLTQFRIEEHAVGKRPQCPACGDAGRLTAQMQAPVTLSAQPKRSTDDNGYRCVTPEETYARFQHLVSPITGLVASMGPMPAQDHPLRHVYGAVSFACPVTANPRPTDFNLASRGKGRTAAQARASALCEALERQSAVFQGDEPLTRATLAQLGDPAIDPRALLNFSETQYGHRAELNRTNIDGRQDIPLPFDEHVAIDWAPAWSLVHQERRYLPAGYCFRNMPTPRDAQFCYADPNGHAAGNCLEEAILQGFLELVERDAVGIWWYNRIPRPAVDLASFEQPYFNLLSEHYQDMGYRLWVLDLTTDIDIPAFVALAHSVEQERYCMGFGSHLDATLGVQRAVTELNQIFEPRATSHAPWGQEALDSTAFVSPDNDLARRRHGEFAGVHGKDLRADVLSCVHRITELGLDFIVQDQTRPDIGLNAVKVVVPGLRHFWPRLGPGRLYDVPVRMGWRDAPCVEDQLNPVPLYL